MRQPYGPDESLGELDTTDPAELEELEDGATDTEPVGVPEGVPEEGPEGPADELGEEDDEGVGDTDEDECFLPARLMLGRGDEGEERDAGALDRDAGAVGDDGRLSDVPLCAGSERTMK